MLNTLLTHRLILTAMHKITHLLVSTHTHTLTGAPSSTTSSIIFSSILPDTDSRWLCLSRVYHCCCDVREREESGMSTRPRKSSGFPVSWSQTSNTRYPRRMTFTQPLSGSSVKETYGLLISLSWWIVPLSVANGCRSWLKNTTDCIHLGLSVFIILPVLYVLVPSMSWQYGSASPLGSDAVRFSAWRTTCII